MKFRSPSQKKAKAKVQMRGAAIVIHGFSDWCSQESCPGVGNKVRLLEEIGNLRN
jgi:hypothetical protein